MADVHNYQIHVRGPVDTRQINAGSPLEMTVIQSDPYATVLSIHTDQSGLVGVVRYLHSQGFELLFAGSESTAIAPTAPTGVSRRRFLRMGCAASAVAGMTLCGIIAAAPDPPPPTLPSFSYGEETMNNRVLIAYATYAGSTTEVAAAIGATLGEHGFSVDVRPARDNPPVDDYQAVIIGSAVQYGALLAEAIAFTTDNRERLSEIPTAAFCVHITNQGHDETSRQNRLAYLDAVRSLIPLVAEGYFAGRFDRRGARLIMPDLLALLMPTMDFRNWEVIRGWAAALPLEPARDVHGFRQDPHTPGISLSTSFM